MFNVVAQQPWRKLDVEGFEDLVECQVLTDYTVLEKGLKRKGSEDKKRKPNKNKNDLNVKSQENEEKSKKIKLKTLKTKKKIVIPKSTPTTTHAPNEEGMGKWEGLGVPEVVLRCLEEMGFVCPTPIQQAALPSAINNRADIIAAAATGSGKTLAFGIPIVTHIMEIDDDDEEEEDACDDDSDTNDHHGSDNDYEEEDDNEELSKINGDVVMKEEEENDDDDQENEYVDEDEEEADDDDDGNPIPPTTLTTSNKKPSKATNRRMYSLILTPTRELAMQVTQHITNICKYNKVLVTAVVGGISLDKQQRLLKKRPHIVVATPGRLWQLIQMREPHLSDTHHLRHMVVDEVDRVVEKGHFEEVQHIISYIQAHSSLVLRRQVFILSATLSFVHKKPHRLMVMKKKKIMKELTLEDKIESLKKTLRMTSKPKIIDLTQGQTMTSQKLQEVKVSCEAEEKDVMLFHLLLTRPERTLVFANSKDAIRRLTSLFTLLHHHPSIQHHPLPLHSDMPMRQRLKNLDAFKARETGLLLATDVAARGLDITAVGRVVHYQVPRTTENYVHRSGRTARSDMGGVSVLLVSPQEDALYRRIMVALKRTTGLEDAQLDNSSLQHHASIVHQARQLEVMEYRQKKERVNADWWRQACKEADILCDDDDSDDDDRHDDNEMDAGMERKALEMRRKELMTMMGVVSRKKKKRVEKKLTN